MNTLLEYLNNSKYWKNTYEKLADKATIDDKDIGLL